MERVIYYHYGKDFELNVTVSDTDSNKLIYNLFADPEKHVEVVAKALSGVTVNEVNFINDPKSYIFKNLIKSRVYVPSNLSIKWADVKFKGEGEVQIDAQREIFIKNYLGEWNPPKQIEWDDDEN